MPRRFLALLLLMLLLCTACSGGGENPPDFSWNTTAAEETTENQNLPVNTYVNINLLTEDNIPVSRKVLTYNGEPLTYRLHLQVDSEAEAEITVFILNNGELLPFSA